MELAAQRRQANGSVAARRLRRTGWLPAVVCGANGESRAIQIPGHEFSLVLRHHFSENLLFDLTVDQEQVRKVLLKEVQHDPVTDEILHADFVEISMTRKMRVRVPVRLAGDPVGVTQEGGILDHFLREVEVECLPGDLVEAIVGDVSGLKLGGTLLVRDLAVPPTLRVLTDSAQPVAGVSLPKEEEEAPPAEGAEAVPAEPEVITEKKEGEEEEEGGEEVEEEGKEGKKAAKPGAKPAGKAAPEAEKSKEKGLEKGAEKGQDKGPEKGKKEARKGKE